MASYNYIPSTDDGLRSFTSNLAAQFTAHFAALGLTNSQSTAYAAAAADFATKLAAAQAPETRGVSTVYAKRVSAAALITITRSLVRIVQACPTVTDQQRVDLGIPVRKTEPTPMPAPGLAPLFAVLGVNGRTVKVRLTDAAHPTSRARPLNAEGATIMTWVGETPGPSSDPGWLYQGIATRNVVAVQFGNDVEPGTKVHLCAFWNGSRGQTSPACEPVSTHIGFGASMAPFGTAMPTSGVPAEAA